MNSRCLDLPIRGCYTAVQPAIFANIPGGLAYWDTKLKGPGIDQPDFYVAHW